MDAIFGFIGNLFGFGAQNQNTAESLFTSTPSPKRQPSPAAKSKSLSAQSTQRVRSRSSSKGPSKTESPVVPKRLKLEEEPKVAKTPPARKPAAARSSAKKTTPSKAVAKGARSAGKASQKSVAKSPKPKTSPKTKTVRKSKTTEAQTPKGTENSIKNTANKRAKWSLNWNGKDHLIVAKDGASDAWYEARPLDVMINTDDRLAKVSEIEKTKLRGIKAPSKKLSHIKAEEGDWVRIHYNGYNDRYDEWIRFCQGGHLCTGDDSACKCERHS